MKVALVYADQSKWPKFDWVRQAIHSQIDPEARTVRNVDQLVAANRECDLVLFANYSAGLGLGDLVEIGSRSRRAKWVQWWFDILPDYVLRGPGANPGRAMQIRFMKTTDMQLVKQRKHNLDELGIEWEYFDQGCPKWIPAVTHAECPEWDVLMPGVVNRPQRRADLMQLAKKYKVAICGHADGSAPPGCISLPWVPVKELPVVMSRAAVMLDVGFRCDLDGYWSDRLWIGMGMGACVVRRESIGQPTGSYESYETTEELMELVGQLRDDVTRRRKIGATARKQVLKRHTYEHRVKELIQLVSHRLKI